jgi:ankyrin repeat domain-containing protein 50
VDERGRTALWYAVGRYTPSVEIVALLIAHGGMDVNKGDSNGQTLLMHACEARSLDVIRFLLDIRDLDINVVDKEGRSALSHAAGCHDPSTEIVKLLTSHEGTDVNIADCRGHTPLMRACDIRSLEIVMILLRIPGIRTDTVDDEGCTALWYAAEGFNPHTEIIKYLANPKAAEISVEDEGDGTPGVYQYENPKTALVPLGDLTHRLLRNRYAGTST